MNKIHVLDCTLRDGGYCNNWQFDEESIRATISGLMDGGIDIIECGFITTKLSNCKYGTLFNSIEDIERIVPKGTDCLFVVMMNYGEYDIDDLPVYDNGSVKGIRVAFHKKDRYEALKLCREVKSKGYDVFVQDMVTSNYSDEEFLELIQLVNDLKPYAFYIVDSFGVMRRTELIRMFALVEHNLNREICIGFHSHNNTQMSYSNAQYLVDSRTKCNLIIDSSIYGMGRGAGNLNTEIFIEYLNEIGVKKYKIEPLLDVIDEILNEIYLRNPWGYSLSNYISARYNAHPNYATYLDEKKTLTIGDINKIFEMMEDDKKTSFDREYVEGLYLSYQEKENVSCGNVEDFRNLLKNQSVLLIAPGSSSISEKNEIVKYAKKNDVIVISINHEFDDGFTDYIFLSNLRRYRELPMNKRKKCIVTSNVHARDPFLQIKYTDLLNGKEGVRDNAGLMAIKFLIQMGVNKILLAGMDGYSANFSDDYAYEKMNFYSKKEIADMRNEGITEVLKEYRKLVEIQFVTSPRKILI